MSHSHQSVSPMRGQPASNATALGTSAQSTASHMSSQPDYGAGHSSNSGWSNWLPGGGLSRRNSSRAPRPMEAQQRPASPDGRNRGRSSNRTRGASGESSRGPRSESILPNSQTRVDSFGSMQQEEPCDACGIIKPDLSFCNVCESIFCSPCWDVQVPHRAKRRGRAGGVRHEKTNIGLAIKINKALAPTNNEQELRKMHEDDVQTAWFGIERSTDGNPPIFRDYGRYSHLLSATVEEWSSKFQTTRSGRDNRTPSLVSFVGQSGAGKSTLIKLLIDLHVSEDQYFRTPVVGAPGSIDPTSEDVHLYADPITAVSEAPLFYADCEGLLGGEREPLSTRLKKSLMKASQSESQQSPISERELEWADTANRRSRQFAVTNLYPRLLYTFSDVIVFVLKNPRVIENVLEQLVEWAAAALEMSSNQPVLPHVIIVLNATENEIEEWQWDPDRATAAVLESIAKTTFQNATFQKYARFWRERKRAIETVEQLILSYYSSIRVIRVPEEGRPHLIQEQINKLYAGICVASEMARERKAALRMLLDAEELQSYLQFAFDHFAVSLDRPFDFVQASFSNSPIPLDFGGNILKLAINLMHVWENKADTRVIFQELSYMVASCIMLDTARRGIKGTARDIFPEYISHLEAALENFCERYWPCEYVQPGTGSRCVNVSSGHGKKGHQNANGKVFADGDYQSRWTFETLHDEFTCNSYFRLEELLERLQSRKGSSDDVVQVAAQIHRDDVMAWFYRHVSQDGKAEKYNSHSVCFCCLSKPPEHPLPCGHVLCTPCIETFGQRRSKTEVDMRGCPLEVLTARVRQPWRIHFKPDSAGVRILTLDGGGIRGIVELEILRSIESACLGMKGRLRIQNFFDLVVGTSTGGLIALGLVARDWEVDPCIQMFKQLCTKAFTRRTGGNLPLIGFLVDSFNHSKYETTPLQQALRNAFSDNQFLFGGQRHDQSWTSPVKVAVTTTSSSTPVLLANYNRQCDDKLSYQFQRAEGIEKELKIWEAARATSAAPSFFKPFHHEASKHTYMDGALYHNNPIKIADSEWKLIWDANPCTHPDILLSLGTGLKHRRNEFLEESAPVRKGLFRNGRSMLKIATDHIQDALDCDKAWGDYIRPLPRAHDSRYVRYNIDVGDLPSLDDVGALDRLQVEVKEYLLRDTPRIKRLALRLIATSFYFETERVQQFSPGSSTATGRIYCRLGEGSREVQELGKLLREVSYRDRNPCFRIHDVGAGQTDSRDIGPDIIGEMIRSGKFQMRKMNIELQNKLSEIEIVLDLNEEDQYCISGFPRCLFDDGKGKMETLRSLPTNARRWAGRSSNSIHERRNLWQPPDKNESSVKRNMWTYKDPSHVMGHATAEQLRETTQILTQGGSTPSVGVSTSRIEVSEIFSREIPRPSPQELDAEQTARPIPIRTPSQANQAHFTANATATFTETAPRGSHPQTPIDQSFNISMDDFRPPLWRRPRGGGGTQSADDWALHHGHTVSGADPPPPYAGREGDEQDDLAQKRGWI